MTQTKIGILGVGHLTSHIVHGFAASEEPLDILLSPRNGELAGELNAKFGMEIAGDNAALVERSDVVLIGVRQFQAIEVVRGLPWRTDHTVVSLCAGLALSELEPHVNGAALARAMPLITARYGESPTCVFPDNAAALDALSRCGNPIVLRSEEEFNAATVSACYSSWVLGVMERMTAWSEDAGLAPETARQVVTEMTRAAAILARERTDGSIGDLIDELATPRSFTEIGYERLQAQDAFTPWNDTADLVFGKLRG